MSDWNKKMIWAILLGLATMVALSLIADFRETVAALRRFRLFYLPVILGLTFGNYLLRFVKWQFFLGRLKIRVSVKDSFAVFLSGLAMSVTPGKVGELLKSLLLKEISGVAVSRSAPVIFAERLSDGFGLIILSLAGLALFRHGKAVVLVVAMIMFGMVAVIKTPPLYNRFLRLCGRLPVLCRFTGILQALVESAGELLTLPSLLFTVAVSVISWSLECVAFYFVFVGLGQQVPLVAATFTLAFSSVVGAVSMLPGGLGAAETSIMGLLVRVVHVPAGVAAVATILIRFCTLWFGVAVGILALAANRRLIGLTGRGDAVAGEGEAVR